MTTDTGSHPYQVVTEHVGGRRVTVFTDVDAAIAYGESFTPETDGSLIPNVSEGTIQEFGGDKTYFKGFFWLKNRYAVMFNMDANYTESL